jgi:transposase InsO family protein
VERVMTDNGACYRSGAWAETCALHQLRHLRTRAYRPRTNGKACDHHRGAALGPV